MPNINLYQNNQEEEKISQSKMVDVGMILAVIFFVLTMIGYGGITYYVKSLETQIGSAREQEMAGRAALKAEEVNLAASTQQRVDLIMEGKDSFDQNNPEKLFVEIQSLMVDGSFVKKMGLSENVLEISFLSSDLQIAARQLASFKKSGMFSGVEINTMGVEFDGKIGMTVSMGINN